ncbi:M20/M25/M40 family metallo-hydrolase [bacterium]|nr:MAG: M20/M25/M40 family metallo-hydrolase [bacterium]
MKRFYSIFAFALFVTFSVTAQQNNAVIDQMVKEANENSQLERLAHELLDVIGPRLVGTPEQKQAHDWAVNQFNAWGIDAKNEQWGEWRGWQRGVTHIDLVAPRTKTLQGMMLAWSPGTSKKGIEAEVIILPDLADSAAYAAWLPNAKGKFVMISANQPTGRPEYNWKEFATEESFQKMKALKDSVNDAWRTRLQKTGYRGRGALPEALEKAGAVGIISSYWSQGFGANKIFSSYTKKIPTLDISLEDYGLLYRLAEYGNQPKIKVNADSKNLKPMQTFNTVATIPGTEKPEEYIVLSAHFDSWDGGQGATDNGTGTITMMEAARLLKKYYPNPKRTIVIGLWGSEEQGLNGSRAFVEDHPELVKGIQAVFNQDNGTGRVTNISGQGFLHAYEFINRWLYPVPQEIKKHIETSFPGTPGGGGSDYASFLAAGAPAFSLSSLSWSYWNYTWHTNLDTYDKIVFDDVRYNAILTAILTYMASEDDKTFPRDQSVLPINPRTGKQSEWPSPRSPNRKGGLD